MDSLARRAREGLNLAMAGVAINLLLGAVKVLGGWLGHSRALMADGIESALDVFSSLMMCAAMAYAQRPPDTEHPYGHGKMESLAAVAGSLLLMAAGLVLGFRSLREFLFVRDLAPSPATYTLAILIGSFLIKEAFFRLVASHGARLESRALEAEAWHHRSDALTSLAAAAGISAALLGGPAWKRADSLAATFSCALILFNGWRMLRSSLGELLDEQASAEIVGQVLAVVRGVPGVTSVEKCRVRKSGFIRFADIHVRVVATRTVREGHEIAHQVKDSLLAAELHLADVTVHIEPENAPTTGA